MKIDSVDFFYLSMPEVKAVADGSQDALLVRVTSGDQVGWGECEASPLVCISNWVCPMSHSACQPMRDSVLGQKLDGVDDIHRITSEVQSSGLDIAQTDHTLSGVEIAMWDILGKHRQQPVYRLLGYEKAYPKTPYASQLFGDDPQETMERGKKVREDGFLAAKFGWGPYGHGSVEVDRDHVMAAREGLGPEGILLVDAGTVWVDDVDKAKQRLAALQEANTTWLEEPFIGDAVSAYAALADHAGPVKLAGGEGAQNVYQAKHLIDYAAVGYIQIDTGRIGGLAPAKQVADYAKVKGVTFVNHTFTTQLALSASIQPFAGIESDTLCEYPVTASDLAVDLTGGKTLPFSDDGQVSVPDEPGLGMEPDIDSIKTYLVDVEITVEGKVMYQSPTLDG